MFKTIAQSKPNYTQRYYILQHRCQSRVCLSRFWFRLKQHSSYPPVCCFASKDSLWSCINKIKLCHMFRINTSTTEFIYGKSKRKKKSRLKSAWSSVHMLLITLNPYSKHSGSLSQQSEDNNNNNKNELEFQDLKIMCLWCQQKKRESKLTGAKEGKAKYTHKKWHSFRQKHCLCW